MIELNNRLGCIYKKQSQSDKAVNLWKNNAENGDYAACIELAKYYEHEAKDTKTALLWTQKADIIIVNSKISRYKKNTQKKELHLRRTRLEKRINGNV